jgi:cell wall-associated NlpC family hydrolase
MASVLSAPSVRVPGLLVLMGLLAIGCGSSRSTSVSVEGASTQPPRDAATVETRLRAAADRWASVPHKLGGTSKQGVDCSGLVQSVYRAEFQMSLPRTTDRQVRVGRAVSRSALQPGDLVFFRHGRKDYHVGIYLSDGEFLHTSSSEGVVVSPLDRAYWTERWWQARRLLDLNGASSPVAADSARSAGSEAKVGW